jgi:hypothetical protein
VFAPRKIIAGGDNAQLLVAQLGICVELDKSPAISLVNSGGMAKASTAGGAAIGKRRVRPPKAAQATDTGQIGLAR